MKKIQFSSDLSQLYFNSNYIHLLHAKNSSSQKLGLLNHRIMSPNEGIVFSNIRLFHTFGMNFPISVVCFDKKKELISKIVLVEKNRLFLCPRKTKYVVETHQLYADESSDTLLSSVKLKLPYGGLNPESRIFILSEKKSKILFCFIKLLPLWIILLSFLFAFAAFGMESINLNLGKTRTINLEQAPQSIQIDDPDMIDLERVGLSNSIKITPKQLGKTSITFQYFDGNEDILNINITGMMDQIFDTIEKSELQDQFAHHLLEDAKIKLKKQGIAYSVNAGKIFILGKMTSIEKFQTIAKIIAPHPQIFLAAYEYDSSLEAKILDSLNRDIRNFGYKNLQVIQIGGKILLKGIHISEAHKEKLWNYVSALLPNVIDNTTFFFGESTLVQINIELFEVGKSTKKEFGLQYPNLSNGVGLTLSADKPFFQVAPFTALFRALNRHNYVREIAKPVIITRSGEKATFLAGGEVPISSVTANGSNTNVAVHFKSVGIIFDVTPRVNDDGTIWLKLNIEYSQINDKLSYQNAPGFNSRKINTNIILNEENTAVISGLIQNSGIKKNDEIYGLSSIPLLGKFFKTQNNTKESTELWIAVSASRKNVEDEFLSTNLPKNFEFKNHMESLL